MRGRLTSGCKVGIKTCPHQPTSQSLHWRSLKARRSASFGFAKAPPLFDPSSLESDAGRVKPPVNCNLLATACKLACFRSTAKGLELFWPLLSSSSMLSSRLGVSSAGMFRRSTTLSLLRTISFALALVFLSPWHRCINLVAKVCSWASYCPFFFKLFWHSLSSCNLATWH